MSFEEFAKSQTGRRVFDSLCKLPGLLGEIVEQMKETNLWLKRMHNATQTDEEPPALTPEPPCTCPGYPMEPETPEEMSSDCPIHGKDAV